MPAYAPLKAGWCLRSELNQRHADFQSAALPTELSGLTTIQILSDCCVKVNNYLHATFVACEVDNLTVFGLFFQEIHTCFHLLLIQVREWIV